MRFGNITLYVPDVMATVEFYERVFGLSRQFVHESGVYAELETGVIALAFAQEDFVGETCHAFAHNRLDKPPAGAEIAFTVDDVAKTYAAVVAAGATAYVEPVQKPWGQTVSYVRDLNGFLVEICSDVTA